MGFGKLKDVDETINNAPKISQYEHSAYNYTVQDPYETIMKNKLNYEEKDMI